MIERNNKHTEKYICHEAAEIYKLYKNEQLSLF